MWIEQLEVRGLRVIQSLSLDLSPGVGFFGGDNGAGKTSILEAVFLLGYGRSFRPGGTDAFVRNGAAATEVSARCRGDEGRSHRVGLRRSGGTWEARCEGKEVSRLSDLHALCPVVLFEPESHRLISGPGELRRRFLDWGLFHVERQFLPVWRGYQRALAQRNAALRMRASAAELDGWESRMGELGSMLSAFRSNYLVQLNEALRDLAPVLLSRLGEVTLTYRPGWRMDSQSLGDALRDGRERDQLLGFTSVGPHRAEWRPSMDGFRSRDALSRGQEKQLALAVTLAQAATLAKSTGEWPVFCGDDLSSELDDDHLRRAIAWLSQTPMQCLISGVTLVEALAQAATAVFHVEQGEVKQLI